MRFRQFALMFALALLATFTLSAQNGQTGYWAPTGPTQEKLYVNSGEGDTNNLTIIDVKTLKIIKKMTTGKHPHGVASPKSQDVLYIASETEGTVTKLDTVNDEILEVYGGWGTEPQESDITPDGRFLYQPSYAGYWNVFDTQKKEIVAYIHTLGIGHNTLIDPDGHYAYLFPIKGGPGHWRRPSLGLPRTQPNEVTVVDITKNHQVVGTIPVGDGPRPPIITADGKRIYMDVDRFMGFLVIDTAARKVIARAAFNLTPDEQASTANGHAHGIAIGNGGKEVWTNATGLDTVFVFDVTANPPKQIARIPVGGGPYWIVPSQDGMTMFVACPGTDEMLVLDVATKKEKTRFKFPAGDHPVRMIDLAVPVRTQRTSR
jgi:YVTN family beta-propeller protein